MSDTLDKKIEYAKRIVKMNQFFVRVLTDNPNHFSEWIQVDSETGRLRNLRKRDHIEWLDRSQKELKKLMRQQASANYKKFVNETKQKG